MVTQHRGFPGIWFSPRSTNVAQRLAVAAAWLVSRAVFLLPSVIDFVSPGIFLPDPGPLPPREASRILGDADKKDGNIAD